MKTLMTDGPLAGLPVQSVARSDFDIIEEKRGEWAVKQYVHRRARFEGREVFVKYRKKHNRTYEEVAGHQYIVDEMKVHFELNKMNTVIVQEEGEGTGIMLDWWENYGTVKDRKIMGTWYTQENRFELVKLIFYDVVTGGLDRHGNNVIVLQSRDDYNLKLLPIDDEDVFYGGERKLVKFDADIKRNIFATYCRNKPKFHDYMLRVLSRQDEIKKLADVPLMHQASDFYGVLESNLKNCEALFNKALSEMIK